MIQGKWFPTGSDVSQPLAIRRAVFGRGRDALDDWAQQVTVYAGEEPVGTARLWWRGGAFWLGDVGVLSDFRGMGYGDLLVRLLLFKALSYGFCEECRQGGRAVMGLAAADVRLDRCGGGCAGCGLCPPDAAR